MSFTAATYLQLARFYLLEQGRLSRHLQYSRLFDDKLSIRPEEVALVTTKRCNLRCLHCYNDSGRRSANDMDAARKLAVVDYLGRWGVTSITLTGGEPTIDTAFPFLLDVAERHQIGVKVATNGWHVPKSVFAGIESGTIVQVSVSLDGAIAKTHDAFRGRQGSFDRVMTFMQQLRNSPPRTLVMNVAVHSGSLPQLARIAEIAANCGADVVSFKPVLSTGRVGSDTSFVLSSQDVFSFRRERDRLERLHRGRLVVDGKVCSHVAVDLRDPVMCLAGVRSMVIRSNGDMVPCDTLEPRPNTPNVSRVAPMEAWLHDPTFISFRQSGARDPETLQCPAAR